MPHGDEVSASSDDAKARAKDRPRAKAQSVKALADAPKV
jgi:hypothetical protein